MRCQDIMKTDVKCCSESEEIQSVARMMRDEGIGFVPICDASMKPVGTLTDRDITIRLLAEGRSYEGVTAGDLMTKQVFSCRPDDDLDEAQSLMSENKVSRILVCDDDGKLVGVISLSDIAEREQKGAAETLRGVSERETRPSVH